MQEESSKEEKKRRLFDMEFNTILTSLALYILIWLCINILTPNFRSRRSTRFLPPGPYQFPVIGNLHSIGKNPHQSFAKLSKIYGPVMSVRLGSKLTIVASSADTAKEVLQKHDLICSSRSVPIGAQSFDRHKFSLPWLPPSTEWRYLRKICREHIFSTQKLDSSQSVREEKLKELRDYVNSCSDSLRTVDIGEAAFTTSLNLISRSLFSIDFANYDSDSSQLKDAVFGVLKYIGTPNLSDFFPVLKPIDPQGIMRNLESCHQNLFNIFDGIINERLFEREAAASGTKKNDFLEALLDESIKNASEFSISDLRHLLFDLFVAGIDTTSVTVEWAMSELMRNPEKLKKGRKELNQVTDERGVVQESDISRLPYLQAIVKETFRLHPAGALLLPHKASEDIEINGYTVPKGTQILVNAYAIGRDGKIWKEPEIFKPERFLDSEIDVKGKHFELIPFGAGRRICPGLPLAYRMVHLMLASLIHNMDWKLEGGIKPQDLNMDEMFGLTVQKAMPLKALPMKL